MYIGTKKLVFPFNFQLFRFYLEMNQWNVQAAICSYFDLENMDTAIPGFIHNANT